MPTKWYPWNRSSTRSFAGPFAPLRVLLSFLTDVISDIPRINFARIYPAIYKNFSKNFTIMCTSAFNSDVCHRLKCPLLFVLRINCNPHKKIRQNFPSKISAKLSQLSVHPPSMMCTSAFNSDVCHHLTASSVRCRLLHVSIAIH